MKVKVDSQAGTVYLRLDESAIVESEEVVPDVILDFNSEGRVVGVEMLDLSNRVSPDKLKVMELEAA